MADRSTVVAVASAGTIRVEGTFQRHISPRYRTLSGSAAGGRWGPEGAYPVLYLGRPTDSIVIEAHRHLVEPVEGMRAELVGPRRLLTCEVRMTHVLDLRDVGAVGHVRRPKRCRGRPGGILFIEAPEMMPAAVEHHARLPALVVPIPRHAAVPGASSRLPGRRAILLIQRRGREAQIAPPTVKPTAVLVVDLPAVAVAEPQQLPMQQRDPAATISQDDIAGGVALAEVPSVCQDSLGILLVDPRRRASRSVASV